MSDFPAFKATKWDTVEDKEKFARHFQKFVESGFSERLFYKWFYTRLSMSFGNIARYNRGCFYDYYFVREESKREFLEHVLSYPCYGDPEWTYSDVEKYLQGWLRDYLSGRGGFAYGLVG
jgi:hypothetical protein